MREYALPVLVGVTATIANGAAVFTSFEGEPTAAQTTSNAAGWETAPGLAGATGTGLTFTTTFTDTRGTGNTGPVDGGEGGDFIGVTSFTGGSSPDSHLDFGPGFSPILGSPGQSYEFNDNDGAITLSLMGGTANQNYVGGFSFWVNGGTGWEADDIFTFGVSDGTTSVTGLTLLEPQLESFLGDTNNPAAEWVNVPFDIRGLGLSGPLTWTVTVDNNAGAENIFVDNFFAIPEPSRALLLSVGVMGLFLRRRR